MSTGPEHNQVATESVGYGRLASWEVFRAAAWITTDTIDRVTEGDRR